MRKKINHGRGGVVGVYEKCWKYIKESRVYFLVIVLLFLFSGLIGFAFPVFFQELIAEFLKDLVEKTAGMGFSELLGFILVNNISTALIGMALGVFLGIIPVLYSLSNGYVLGYVSRIVVDEEGFPVLFRLVPHGIFEIPALILSLGIGLRLAGIVFSKNRRESFVYNLGNAFRVFFFVIVPLLLIAGIIESLLIFLF